MLGKRKPKGDDNTAIVRAGERLTDSEPVEGEDLLRSPELKRQLREAKERERESGRFERPR